MTRHASLSTILSACLALYLAVAGPMTVAHAGQDNTGEALRESPQQAGPHVIEGKVTEVIHVTGFTYVEVDTGRTKVWSAAPVSTSIKAGDTVSFPAAMPIQDFHSKSLGRNFPLIYFVKQYITDKEQSKTPGPSGEITEHRAIHPAITLPASTTAEVPVGSTLREAALDGLNGKNKRLSDYQGKPLIINVWASWCGPCRAEMASLERLAQRHNGKAFNIIGISTDDYRNRATAFIEQSGISFDNFIDHQLELENMLGVRILPLTILVNADGRVLHKVSGSREWDNPMIMEAIAEVFHIDSM